jgi:hypothetical protein
VSGTVIARPSASWTTSAASSKNALAATAGKAKNYFRAPRTVPFNLDCLSFFDFRFGLVIRNVPLPLASA